MEYLDLTKEEITSLMDRVYHGVVNNDLEELSAASIKSRKAFGITDKG